MTNLNHSKQINFAEQITLASLAIKSTLQTVKTLFHHRELSEINYSDHEVNELVVEVRFDSVTLTCVFNNHKVCEGVFLFPDDVLDIAYYIEYCNTTYPCDYRLQCWLVNDCFITIYVQDAECSLLVFSTK
jgi:hypothetical protein